ncbi:tetratricopeptide repeat protein [Candidatus Parabeggiatoa sp. HSG14]|uniref:CHAT domain-containing tetratricopeptide repeat protein n=1 Tax=Candidatus Parabeggiatoa sp. HSG14 TaxID=3055593 RepID=UPI0025A8EA68|nr:tetratricopeptide repeat protein [Thiotrichales bacterium HSG14]
MKYLCYGFILMFLSLSIKADDALPEDINNLHKAAKQAFLAADYPAATAKWGAALIYARSVNNKKAMSKFLVNLGVINYSLGQYKKALDYYQQALIVDREIGNKEGESSDLNDLGFVFYSLSNYQKALNYYQQALAIQKKSNDEKGQSKSFGNLSLVYSSLGQYKEALKYGEHALELHRKFNDQQGIGNDLINLGMLYDNLGEYSIAVNYYQQALEIKKELGDNRGVANSLSNIGVVYINLGDYPKALSHFQQALKIYRSLGDLSGVANNLTNIGAIYNSLGQYPNALTHYQQALQIQSKIGDMSGVADNLSNLGLIYTHLGKYSKALNYYQEALQIQRDIGDQRGIGKNLSHLGVIYSHRGNYSKALDYYQQALTINRRIGHQSGEGNNLTNLGAVYNNLGQYPKALTYYLDALEIQRQLGDQQQIAHNFSNMGVLYFYLGHSEKAFGYLSQALTIRRDIGDKRGEGIDLSNLGGVYDSLGQHTKARKYFQKALKIRRSIGDRYGMSADLSNLGAVYGNLGKYRQALSYFQQALVIDRELGDKIGGAANLSNLGLMYQQAEQYEKARLVLIDSLTQFEILGHHNLWYAQRGLASVEIHLNNSKAAINHYEQALGSIEQLRTGLKNKADKLSFIQDKLYVYDEFILLLQTLHKKYPEKGYDRKALEIFERKQGRVFLEEIGKSGAQRFARLPESVTKKEQLLAQNVVKTQGKLVQARNKPFIKQEHVYINKLTQHLAILKAEQQSLQAEISAKYPAYYAIKYPQPVTIAILQNKVLQSGELMLVYNVMAESTVFWIIGQHQFAMFTLPVGEEELTEYVAYMRDVILNRLPEVAEEGFPLYQMLIPKRARQLLTKAHTLYIVPTGPLYMLPFEALVTHVIDDYEPYYLIQDHAVVYLSSASLLKALRDTKTKRKALPHKKLLAFADPAYIPCQNVENNGDVRKWTVDKLRTNAYRDAMGIICFPSLPDTANEAKAVATLFKSANNTLYLGEKANRDIALHLSNTGKMIDYRYLLFAVHGLLPNEIQGLTQSSLVLSNQKSNAYLTMADTFTLQLNADFINLSACNTGGGKKIKGEGIIGLTRAFMYAGTPAISVTLWSVESSSAANLSIGMFSNLKDGKQPAEALRQIKLKMIAGNADHSYYSHPFYWAPFVVYGDGG